MIKQLIYGALACWHMS